MKSSNNIEIKSFFASLGKAIVLVFLCVISALVLVFPFWFFADKAPKVYSIVFTILIIFAILSLIVFSILRKYKGKTSDEKKVLTHNYLRSLLIFVLCAISIIVPVILVLSYFRIAALIVFILGFTCVGLSAFFIKKR